jgi:hypothetical protein
VSYKKGPRNNVKGNSGSGEKTTRGSRFGVLSTDVGDDNAASTQSISEKDIPYIVKLWKSLQAKVMLHLENVAPVGNSKNKRNVNR